MRIIKLGDISDISTGLVLSRKQAQEHNAVKKYKLLTVKSIDEGGWINGDELDEYFSIEELDSKYLTQEGDNIIRLSQPNTVVTIDKSNVGIVISSLFAYIRLKTELILPGYLSILMNSDKLRMFLERNSYGSSIKTINTSALKDLNLKVLPIEEQKRIIELHKLILKEKFLLRKLMREKNDYHNELINRMLEGSL